MKLVKSWKAGAVNQQLVAANYEPILCRMADDSVTIAHAENTRDLFHLLDEEGDPCSVKAWVSKEQARIITNCIRTGEMSIHRDLDYHWMRVVMPSLETIYGKEENDEYSEA